jgi:hypothetical protein
MRAVFEGLLDYAGLFPPANLGMTEAVEHYDRYRRSPDRSMLARFVVAASRLDELGAAVDALRLEIDPDQPWQISVVAGANLPQELERINAFRKERDHRGLLVDAVEHRVASLAQVAVVGELLPAHFQRFLEVPHEGPYTELVHAIARIGALAKVRTGGTKPSLFPSPRELTQFLIAVTAQRLPFKATAGLHHPFRGSYPLTYEPDSDRFVMYGFVNLLLATAELYRSGDGKVARRILEEADASAFECTPDAIAWRGTRFPAEELVTVRTHAFLGFGSCSFREPVDALHAMAVA